MKHRRSNTATRPDGGGVCDQAPLPDGFYRHLCEHAGVAMISCDSDLVIQTWNAVAAQMFGASAEGMRGAKITSVIPVADREHGEQVIREALEQERIGAFEFEHRDDQGQPRTLAVIVSPILDDEGVRLGALACVRDITNRVQLQSELAQRNKMVAMGRMAGALAHHFNNILGGAVTSVDFALTIDDPALQERTLRQTSDVLGRATNVINSLLAFAEGDKRHEDECDLTEVILETAEGVQRRLADVGVRIELDLEAIPVTSVPREQMVTVLENIIRNAVDAMAGGGVITVSTRMERGVVVLDVADTGCGMDDAVRQFAFEPFYSTKSSGELNFEDHPGLGLAVTHGILQVLGHAITLQPRKPHGTVVTIRFGSQSS